MGFIGKQKLGFVVRIKGGFVIAWRRVWPCARLWEHAYPAGAYFCMRKSRQNALGAVPQDPLAAKLRLDTNDAKASSVRRRRYALKVPAAHFIFGAVGTKLKINLISVV